MKFPEFVQRYDASHLTLCERSTRYQSLLQLETHLIPYFRTHELADIDHAEIEDFAVAHLFKGKKLAAKTINNILGVLSGYLKFCAKRGKQTGMERMPDMFWMPKPKEPPRPHYLTTQQLQKLFDVVNDQPYQLMLLVAASTGMRVGELVALQWGDIDWKLRQINVRKAMGREGSKLYEKVPKNGYARQIPMTDAVHDALKSHLRLGDHVLMSHRYKTPLTPGAAYKALLKYNRRAGLKINGWHLLRHTFATHAMAVTQQVNDVRILLGHQTFSETMRYAHVREGQGRGTVQALENVYTPLQSARMTQRAPKKKSS